MNFFAVKRSPVIRNSNNDKNVTHKLCYRHQSTEKEKRVSFTTITTSKQNVGQMTNLIKISSNMLTRSIVENCVFISNNDNNIEACERN